MASKRTRGVPAPEEEEKFAVPQPAAKAQGVEGPVTGEMLNLLNEEKKQLSEMVEQVARVVPYMRHPAVSQDAIYTQYMDTFKALTGTIEDYKRQVEALDQKMQADAADYARQLEERGAAQSEIEQTLGTVATSQQFRELRTQIQTTVAQLDASLNELVNSMNEWMTLQEKFGISDGYVKTADEAVRYFGVWVYQQMVGAAATQPTAQAKKAAVDSIFNEQKLFLANLNNAFTALDGVAGPELTQYVQQQRVYMTVRKEQLQTARAQAYDSIGIQGGGQVQGMQEVEEVA